MIASQKRPAQVEVAGDRPALDQRLALPGASSGHVIAERRAERAGQRTLLAVGPQPHVDAVGHAQRRVLGQQPDDLAAHPREELGVGDDLRAGRLPVLVVEEDQVDVRAVVELLRRRACPGPARRTARRAAAGGTRNAVPRLGARPGQPDGGLDAGVGQVGEVLRDHLQRKPADDVVVADPQALALAEPPQGQRLLVLVVQSRRASSQSSSISADRSRRSAPGPQPVEQLGVADQDLAEVLAGAEDLEQDLGRPRCRRRARASVALEPRAPRPGTARGSPAPCRGRGSGAGRRRAGRRAGRRPVERIGPGPAGQVGQVAAAALGVADAQPGKPAPGPARESRGRSGTSRRSSESSQASDSCRAEFGRSSAGRHREETRSGADVLEWRKIARRRPG